MHQKIEVEVNMHCEKCRTDVLKSVTKLSGIDQVSVDLEKQVLVVVGDDVDPVSVVERVKKTGKRAKIITVGPSKKPDPPDSPTCEPIISGYPYPVCTDVYPVAVVYPQPCNYETGGCVIQ
ncbi:putative heavy metal-associated domain, HMA, heavy metal-associated domain superfamily [Helianthus debilis subsp. tardiflorus]